MTFVQLARRAGTRDIPGRPRENDPSCHNYCPRLDLGSNSVMWNFYNDNKPPPTIRTSSFLRLARSLSLSSSPTLIRSPKECWRPPPWDYISVVCVRGTTLRADRTTVENLLWNSWLEITNSWRRMHFHCGSSCVDFASQSSEGSFFQFFLFKKASLDVRFKNSRILKGDIWNLFSFFSYQSLILLKFNFAKEILSIS